MKKKLKSLKRINWKAVCATAVAVAGALSHPAVLALVPAKAAAVITAAGVVLQALTGAAHKPKSEG